MHVPQLLQAAKLLDAELTDALLRKWDWKADLRADERTFVWLARHTGMSARSVYDYVYGKTDPPVAWLRRAWRVIHMGERKTG